jgi:hypothetical protein
MNQMNSKKEEAVESLSKKVLPNQNGNIPN